MKDIVGSGTLNTIHTSFHPESVSFIHLKTLDPKLRKDILNPLANINWSLLKFI